MQVIKRYSAKITFGNIFKEPIPADYKKKLL